MTNKTNTSIDIGKGLTDARFPQKELATITILVALACTYLFMTDYFTVLQVNPEAQMKQIEEAKEFFLEILHVNPDDKVARIYVQRCENIQQYGIAEEWKGVWAWIESLRNRGV